MAEECSDIQEQQGDSSHSLRCRDGDTPMVPGCLGEEPGEAVRTQQVTLSFKVPRTRMVSCLEGASVDNGGNWLGELDPSMDWGRQDDLVTPELHGIDGEEEVSKSPAQSTSDGSLKRSRENGQEAWQVDPQHINEPCLAEVDGRDALCPTTEGDRLDATPDPESGSGYPLKRPRVTSTSVSDGSGGEDQGGELLGTTVDPDRRPGGGPYNLESENSDLEAQPRENVLSARASSLRASSNSTSPSALCVSEGIESISHEPPSSRKTGRQQNCLLTDSPTTSLNGSSRRKTSDKGRPLLRLSTTFRDSEAPDTHPGQPEPTPELENGVSASDTGDGDRGVSPMAPPTDDMNLARRGLDNAPQGAENTEGNAKVHAMSRKVVLRPFIAEKLRIGLLKVHRRCSGRVVLCKCRRPGWGSGEPHVWPMDQIFTCLQCGAAFCPLAVEKARELGEDLCDPCGDTADRNFLKQAVLGLSGSFEAEDIQCVGKTQVVAGTCVIDRLQAVKQEGLGRKTQKHHEADKEQHRLALTSSQSSEKPPTDSGQDRVVEQQPAANGLAPSTPRVDPILKKNKFPRTPEENKERRVRFGPTTLMGESGPGATQWPESLTSPIARPFGYKHEVDQQQLYKALLKTARACHGRRDLCECRATRVSKTYSFPELTVCTTCGATYCSLAVEAAKSQGLDLCDPCGKTIHSSRNRVSEALQVLRGTWTDAETVGMTDIVKGSQLLETLRQMIAPEQTLGLTSSPPEPITSTPGVLVGTATCIHSPQCSDLSPGGAASIRGSQEPQDDECTVPVEAQRRSKRVRITPPQSDVSEADRLEKAEQTTSEVASPEVGLLGGGESGQSEGNPAPAAGGGTTESVVVEEIQELLQGITGSRRSCLGRQELCGCSERGSGRHPQQWTAKNLTFCVNCGAGYCPEAVKKARRKKLILCCPCREINNNKKVLDALSLVPLQESDTEVLAGMALVQGSLLVKKLREVEQEGTQKQEEQEVQKQAMLKSPLCSQSGGNDSSGQVPDGMEAVRDVHLAGAPEAVAEAEPDEGDQGTMESPAGSSPLPIEPQLLDDSTEDYRSTGSRQVGSKPVSGSSSKKRRGQGRRQGRVQAGAITGNLMDQSTSPLEADNVEYEYSGVLPASQYLEGLSQSVPEETDQTEVDNHQEAGKELSNSLALEARKKSGAPAAQETDAQSQGAVGAMLSPDVEETAQTQPVPDGLESVHGQPHADKTPSPMATVDAKLGVPDGHFSSPSLSESQCVPETCSEDDTQHPSPRRLEVRADPLERLDTSATPMGGGGGTSEGLPEGPNPRSLEDGRAERSRDGQSTGRVSPSRTVSAAGGIASQSLSGDRLAEAQPASSSGPTAGKESVLPACHPVLNQVLAAPPSNTLLLTADTPEPSLAEERGTANASEAVGLAKEVAASNVLALVHMPTNSQEWGGSGGGGVVVAGELLNSSEGPMRGDLIDWPQGLLTDKLGGLLEMAESLGGDEVIGGPDFEAIDGQLVDVEVDLQEMYKYEDVVTVEALARMADVYSCVKPIALALVCLPLQEATLSLAHDLVDMCHGWLKSARLGRDPRGWEAEAQVVMELVRHGTEVVKVACTGWQLTGSTEQLEIWTHKEGQRKEVVLLLKKMIASSEKGLPSCRVLPFASTLSLLTRAHRVVTEQMLAGKTNPPELVVRTMIRQLQVMVAAYTDSADSYIERCYDRLNICVTQERLRRAEREHLKWLGSSTCC